MTHQHRQSRRGFLQTAGAGTAASLAYLGGRAAPTPAAEVEGQSAKSKAPFTLALASYTLRKFGLDETLKMTQRVGLGAVCLKSFHLPLDATPDEIAAAVAKVKEAGIVLYGGGVIGMKNPEQTDQAFEYAKAAGMIRIVAAPTVEMLPRINEKIQQYDIEVCIHNHGPGDKHFPTPTVAYEKLDGMDKRFGICHDIGHTIRYGECPIEATRKCADRILDLHFKDVTEASKKGHSTPCGRGVIDLPAMLRTLVDIHYTGYAAFEYEEHADDPLPGLAESVGYVRGVLDAM
jgi:sugar phosphate isomerase/epimerase